MGQLIGSLGPWCRLRRSLLFLLFADNVIQYYSHQMYNIYLIGYGENIRVRWILSTCSSIINIEHIIYFTNPHRSYLWSVDLKSYAAVKIHFSISNDVVYRTTSRE